MSSGDFNNLALRKTTAYNPDGSFVADGSVFTVGSNGKQNWTSNLNLNNLTLSTFTLNSQLYIPSSLFDQASISSLNTSSFATSSFFGINVIVCTLQASTIVLSTVSYQTVTTTNLLTTFLTGTSLIGSTIQTTNLNTSTLIGDTISTNYFVAQSTLIGSTLSTLNLGFTSASGLSLQTVSLSVASTFTGSTLQAANLTLTNGLITSTLVASTLSLQSAQLSSTLAVSTVNTVNMSYSTLSGSTLHANAVVIDSTLVVSTVNTVNFGASTLQGSTLAINNIIWNSTLTGSTLNALRMNYSTLSGSTLSLNTGVWNSTLTGSTINAVNMGYSTLSGSTIGSNTVVIQSTLMVSTVLGSTVQASTMTTTTIQASVVGFSTMTGSTLTINQLTVGSTLTTSTVNTVNMTYSTLQGGTIQTSGLIASTLTGSTINFTNLGFSTLSISTITSNVSFPLLISGSTISTTTLTVSKLLNILPGGQVGVGTSAPTYPVTISNPTMKGLEMNTIGSTITGAISSFITGTVYSATNPINSYRGEYVYAYGGASTMATVQSGVVGYYAIDIAGSAGVAGQFATDTVGPLGATFYLNNTKAIIQSNAFGVGTTNPQWPITAAQDLSLGSITSNPLGAQLVVRGKTGTGAMKFGAFYTSGSGTGVIQSTDIATGFDVALPLVLNPLGGNVGIGVTAPSSTLQLPSYATTNLGGTLSIQSDVVSTDYTTAAFTIGYNSVSYLYSSPTGTYLLGAGDTIGSLSYNPTLIAGALYQLQITLSTNGTSSPTFYIRNVNTVLASTPITSTPTVYSLSFTAPFTGVINFLAGIGASKSLYITSFQLSRMDTVTTGALGIGTTNPPTSLYVNGNAFINNNAGVNAPVTGTYGGVGDRLILWPGTSTTYPYSVGINHNTLWYSSPSQQQWYINQGTLAMTLANTGYVGIGTANPGGLLHLYNSTADRQTSLIVQTNRAGIWLTSTGTGGGSFNIWTTLTGEGPGGGALAIYDVTNSAFRMVINSSGYVGIGISNPVKTFQVAGNATIGYISGSKTGLYFNNEDAYGTTPSIQGISSAFGVNALSINPAGGYVGIGTATPGYNLDINGGTNINVLAVRSNTTDVAMDLINLTAGGNTWRLGSSGTSAGVGAGKFYIYDSTTSTFGMVINSSGYVGIGTASPISKLTVKADGNSTVTEGSAHTVTLMSVSNNTLAAAPMYLTMDCDAARNVCSLQSIISGVSMGPLSLNPIGGYVGIGKTNPGSALDVNGTVTATAFSGPISGTATGLTGSPSITVTNLTVQGTVSGLLPYFTYSAVNYSFGEGINQFTITASNLSLVNDNIYTISAKVTGGGINFYWSILAYYTNNTITATQQPMLVGTSRGSPNVSGTNITIYLDGASSAIYLFATALKLT